MDLASSDGEAAIEHAILAAYSGSKPGRYGGRPGRVFPLAGCFALRVEEPSAHWLIVSRGFSELHEKEEKDTNVSGWGFELTCRVAARSDVQEIGWVIDWMQGIADFLSERRVVLEPFHHMSITDPRDDDEICALVFVDDIALAPTSSRNGNFSFLQLWG